MALQINNIPKQVAKNTSDIAELKRRVGMGKYLHTIVLYESSKIRMQFVLLNNKADTYESSSSLIADLMTGGLPYGTPATGIDYVNSTLIQCLYSDGEDVYYVDSNDDEYPFSSSWHISDTVQEI